MRLSDLTRVTALAAVLLALPASAQAQGVTRFATQPLVSTLNTVLATDLFEQQGVGSYYVSGLAASGATLTVQGSFDNKSVADPTKVWTAISAVSTSCPATSFTTLTTDQSFKVDTAALTAIRLLVSSAGSGSTINVSFDAIPGTGLTTANCGSGSSPAGGGATSASLNYPFTFTPTVNNNTAYTANFSMGGLQTVSVFRTAAQPSAIFNYLSLSSKSGVGATGGVAVYAFNKLPTSTCTNNIAFALASGDLPYLIPGFPITLTPATSVGATQAVASASLNISTANQDTALTTNLYFCLVAVATPTTSTTSDIVVDGAMLRD